VNFLTQACFKLGLGSTQISLSRLISRSILQLHLQRRWVTRKAPVNIGWANLH